MGAALGAEVGLDSARGAAWAGAEAPRRGLARWGPVEGGALTFLRSAADRLVLGARTTERVLRVGRAIADLDGADWVTTAHLAEALQYRVLDRRALLVP